ncbi:MAG TPA: SURF1 family cytochrome oxidase biogenesis protein [Aeromicrobium sp.]|nr:SURF1 family cytochrome oxidase biogenesis protein [Aeromicrobium sp.]
MTDRPKLRDWFSPRLLGLHVFALVAIGFCLFMATWQLGVYDQHQVAEAPKEPDKAAVAIEKVWGPGEVFTTDHDQLRVSVTGQFRPADEQFWVTNEKADGTEGVWLVAPVTVEGAELMVVRGWLAEPVSPMPSVPQGETTFDAVLQPGAEPGAGWDEETRTIGSLRIPTLLNELGYDQLWSGYAITTDKQIAAPAELAEVPENEVSWTTGGRNLGYGLQWWVFAGFAAFMWWRIAREMVFGDDR